jgi:hypothetical protein
MVGFLGRMKQAGRVMEMVLVNSKHERIEDTYLYLYLLTFS